MTTTYNKICELFEQRIGSCTRKTTRTLLAPILMSINLYEKERATNIRQKLFAEICTEFQWYYWMAEDYYGGTGEWREFPPVCASQLNKAVKENKTSVQVTLSQRNYIVDFTEMTKRLVSENMASLYHNQNTSPICIRAFKKEGFNIDKYLQLLKKLNASSDQHYPIINGILKLVESSEFEPLETDLACTALTLLLRLITREGMAKDFVKTNAIPTLLKIRCTKQTVKTGMTAPLISTLIALILRQCIDCEDDSLRQSFEDMINNTCRGCPISMLEATSRKNQMVLKRYQKDPKRVFRLLTPLAAIAPDIFLDAVKQSLVIKKGELQLNEQPTDPAKMTLKHENLNKVMHELVKELLSENADRKEKADERILNSASLLKLIAEILRSYPQASLIFVQMSYKGDSAMKQIIRNFLLNNADPKNAEMGAAAKAVLSCLMTSHATSKVTDQIVDDLKLLLCSITEEYTNGNCNAATTIEKTKISIKFADQLTIITRLLIVLKETVTHQTYSLYVPNDSKQTALALTKSIHKKNLLNDFIKTIWTLPLHERQGIEAVNTLLKLLEGIIGKDVSNLIQPDGNGRNEERQHLDIGPPPIHDDSSAAENPDEDDEEEDDDDEDDDGGDAIRQDPDTTANESMGSQSQHNAMNSTMNEVDNVNAPDGDGEEHDDDEEEHDAMEDDVGSNPEDDSTSQSDEDMTDAMAMDMEAAEQEGVAHARAEIDHNSAHMEEVAVHISHHHQNNLIADELATVDEMDDDNDEEDDDEDEEDEGHDHEETLVEFEEAIQDYIDMPDFNNFANEVNIIQQNINRISMNMNNAFGNPTYQQALMQMPRNIRALIHPRGRGAVLRIRNQFHHHPHQIPIHIGIGHGPFGGQHPLMTHVMSTLAGHWPAFAWEGINSMDDLDRMTPYFLDRVADQCRVLDSNLPFHIGTVLVSYICSVIEVPPDQPTSPAEEKTNEVEKTAAEMPPVEGSAAVEPQREITETYSNSRVQQNASSEPDSHSNNQQMRPMEEQTVAAPELEQTQTATSATNSDEQMSMTEQETAVVVEIGTTNMEETGSQQQQEVTSSTNTVAAIEASGQPTVENTPNQIVQTTQAAQDSSIDQQQQPVASAAQVPEGVDPAFLAALPEDMRQEVIRDHLLQQQMNSVPVEQPVEQDLPPERLAAILGMEVPEGMDPAFLAALPEDIFQEVVRDHQRQQELARQRQAQRQAQSTARHRIERQGATRHVHRLYRNHHNRHPIYGIQMRNHQGQLHQHVPPTTLSDARAIQLLDQEGISTLLLLYFFDQEKINTTRLQKILRSVCVNPASCDFVIWSLMSMLHGLEKFGPVDNDGGGSQHSQIGWVNNIRMGSTLDKNERLLQITANTVNINPQIRSTATQQIVDTLCYLAQRFANHFMPKNIRHGGKQQQQPPSNIVDHFWPIVRSINEKSTEDALRSIQKPADLQEIIADKLEKSPFAFIIELTSSNLAQKSQPFLDKIIRAALMLSQGLTSNIYEKATPETKQWVTQRLGYLINILMEKSTNESFMEGQVLIAKMLEIFPSECQQILGALRHGITKNADQLKVKLSAYQEELAKMPSPKDDIQ